MALRRVFFGLDYERDLFRVNKIRRVQGIISCAAAGFESTEVWERAKRRGDAAVHGLVNDGLNNTTVTVICIGQMTSFRHYVHYEIERSLERENSVVGIKIHHLPNEQGIRDEEGTTLPELIYAGFKVYAYTDAKNLAAHIEEAAILAQQIFRKVPHDVEKLS